MLPDKLSLLLWRNVRHLVAENIPSQQQAHLFPRISPADPVALVMQHETFPVSPDVTLTVLAFLGNHASP